MTTAFLPSNNELIRVHNAAYQGRIARVCLATSISGLTRNSTTAQWDAVEITDQAANGYERVQFTIPSTNYSNASTRAETAKITALFQATENGNGLQYDTVYVVLGTGTGQNITWDTSIAFLYAENPTIALAPGEPRGYKLFGIVDDAMNI